MQGFVQVVLAMLVAVVGVPAALAKDKWHKVAELEVTTQGGREIPVATDISKIRFYVLEGSVIINGFAIRQGNEKTSFTVGRRIEKDRSEDIDVGKKTKVTGLVVSEDGKGKYRIYVQH